MDFALLVIGPNPEKQMEPFKGLEELADPSKSKFAAFHSLDDGYRRDFESEKDQWKSFEEFMEKGTDRVKDPKTGLWGFWYNPNWKWSFADRRNLPLKLEEGETEDDRLALIEAEKSEVELDLLLEQGTMLYPQAILKDGVWLDSWHDDYKTMLELQKEWPRVLQDALAQVADDEILALFYCHKMKEL